MTILQIFNRYQFAGGEEASVLRVAETLEKKHTVIRCYFESRHWAGDDGIFALLKHGIAMLYNPKVIRQVFKIIASEKPDIILLHNIFPICSAGLLWRLVRQPIPVVQYIHNFRPYSVNGYCWVNNQLCNSGLDLNFFPEIAGASWQNSRIKTAWYAINLWLLHITGSYRKVSAWLAISEFMKDVFSNAGIDRNKITVIKHSWNALNDSQKQLQVESAPKSPPYLLFLGRLTDEKGIRILVEAWEIALSQNPNAELLIGGQGPLEDWIRKQTQRLPRLRYLGHVSGKQKAELLAGTAAMVVPSIWWEPLGIVVYEAYDYEKPVLAAASGGLGETVTHEQTGLLHSPGNAKQLAEHMVELLANPERGRIFGKRGREFLLSSTNPSAWAESIESTFARITKISGSTQPRSVGRGRVKSVRTGRSTLDVSVYLADQNPGYDRSFGISRMTQMILSSLRDIDEVKLETVVSKTSQQGPSGVSKTITLPWGTRQKWVRLISDHLHPLFTTNRNDPDLYYFPKGYLPFLDLYCNPSVVTIHDTIIQYDKDHYPDWRSFVGIRLLVKDAETYPAERGSYYDGFGIVKATNRGFYGTL